MRGILTVTCACPRRVLGYLGVVACMLTASLIGTLAAADTAAPKIANPTIVAGQSSRATDGGITISRLALRFENGSPIRVVTKRDTVKALAEINFTGSALFQAEWVIAEPLTTPGRPIFRTLRLVRRHLTGKDRIIVESPELPVDYIGQYYVGLRVTHPEVGFETPYVRYFVMEPVPGTD